MRPVFDGRFQVRWLTSDPAQLDAPTAIEVAAGENITSFVPKDGIKFGVTNNRVAADQLDQVFDAEGMGTWGGQIAVTFYRDDTADTVWDLWLRGETGCIVVLPFPGPTTAPADGMLAMVLPGLEVGQVVPLDPAKNEKQKAMAEFAASVPPEFNAVIGGGPQGAFNSVIDALSLQVVGLAGAAPTGNEFTDQQIWDAVVDGDHVRGVIV